ncbi:winged helix-turn-helix domain-containing protein [Ruegeria arenilitoris]|uniref:winged helix-turn-helix domain-containing protein n=1 Tax=Ruegeria arenilitoris TaxID=1173585 RepID=UPI001481474D
MKLLLLEDNLEITQRVEKGLGEAGHSVDCFENGPDALFAATTRSYDVLILDRMVPELDGLSVLKALRAAKNTTPVLMLTALNEVTDRVEGLEAGADDYLAKPFAISELTARIVAICRRSQAIQANEETTLKYEDLELDLLARTCRRGDQIIELHAKEIRLLEVFMRNRGRVLTRSMLLEKVWDINFDPETNVVNTNVSRLRNKIDKPFNTALLRTVRGAGYVFGA